MNSILLYIDVHAIRKPEASFLVLGGPLSSEALGRLPTLPKVKAGSAQQP